MTLICADCELAVPRLQRDHYEPRYLHGHTDKDQSYCPVCDRPENLWYLCGTCHDRKSWFENRDAHMGNRNPLGYRHTDEARERMRQANLGRRHTSEAREKNRLAALEQWRRLKGG